MSAWESRWGILSDVRSGRASSTFQKQQSIMPKTGKPWRTRNKHPREVAVPPQGGSSPQLAKELKRWDLINAVLPRGGAFLEIGAQAGVVASRVREDAVKWGVDPAPHQGAPTRYQRFFRGTSDEFFAQLRDDERVDVVFIDGLHHAEQVYRDVVNSLRFLSEGGTIVLHDCYPPSQEAQQVPRDGAAVWTGDCWKAIVKLRREHPELLCFVVDADFGLGVVRRLPRPSPAPLANVDGDPFELEWADLKRHPRLLLGLTPEGHWRKRLEREVFIPHHVRAKISPSNNLSTPLPLLSKRYQEELVSKARRFKGMKVLLAGFGTEPIPQGLGARQAAELMRQAGVDCTFVGGTSWGMTSDRDRSEVRQSLTEAKPDVALFATTHLTPFPELDLRQNAGSSGLWFQDLRPPKPSAVAAAGLFDAVFLCWKGEVQRNDFRKGQLCSTEQWSRVLGCPSVYMPQGSFFHDPAPFPSKWHNEVLFVGDVKNQYVHAGRANVCYALGASVLNAGGREKREENEQLSKFLYRHARVSLSMSPLAECYTSVRPYNLLASGGFMLQLRFPGCERLFVDGKHCRYFDSVEEAEAVVQEVKANEDMRNQIASGGWHQHQSHHTVAHRVLNMVESLVDGSDTFNGWVR